jgi:DNA anti-recombination protein RmuC
MLNSIIFLLGSLVMLLPFGTSLNIISNAMAEEMNPYLNNEDSMEKYGKFYNDDSFREDYYNYHKKHHQLESQQLQIENEVQQSNGQEQEQQNSMTESLPQQSTEQQRPSIISQEQMHQQQIVKLKQLLEGVR